MKQRVRKNEETEDDVPNERKTTPQITVGDLKRYA